MDLHEIAKEIAGAGGAGLHLRQGLVTAAAGDGTVTVKIAGSAVAISGVRAFSSAAPTVGAAVWLAIDGTLVLVIGSIGAGASVPTGTILDFGGTAAPSGYLLCNGAAVSRSTYAALFAAISTAYGAGDGSTTFNVPNARDRFRVGAGVSYAPGNTGGEATHALSVAEMPSHAHGGATNTVSSDHHHNLQYTTATGDSGSTFCFLVRPRVVSGQDAGLMSGITANHTHQVYAEGSGGAHENRPPYLAATAIIKT